MLPSACGCRHHLRPGLRLLRQWLLRRLLLLRCGAAGASCLCFWFVHLLEQSLQSSLVVLKLALLVAPGCTASAPGCKAARCRSARHKGHPRNALAGLRVSCQGQQPLLL